VDATPANKSLDIGEWLPGDMNRREFLTGMLGKALPQAKKSLEIRVDALEIRDQEIEAALKNQGEASFMRDQALLVLFDPKLGITYYGTILRDYARDEKKE